MSAYLLTSSFFREQQTNFSFITAAVSQPKSDVLESCNTVPVDEHAGGHACNLVLLGERSLRVELHRESGGISLQESLSIGPVVIEIDGNNSQTFPRVHLLHLLHPGKGLTTRHAPRGPKVQVNDLSSQMVQIKGGTSLGQGALEPAGASQYYDYCWNA
jgi:hypothetical protein